ncbi:MAG: thioredoxin family protein [Pseudomonadota bacterium]
MLSDQELLQLQIVGGQITKPPKIIMNPIDEDDPFEKRLFNVARQAAGVTMERIGLGEGRRHVFPGKPCLSISREGNANIHYMAVPSGTEFAPFLDALSMLGGAADLPASEHGASLDDLKVPLNVLVLIAEACPHCPAVVQKLIALAIDRPLINLVIADAVRFQDLAERYKVKSTPTVIINDGATLVGQVSVEELVRRMIPAGDSGSLTEVLDSMMKAGRAEDAADLVIKTKQPDALLPLYRAREFSGRMAALLVMEEALAREPRVLDPLVPELTKLLFDDEAPLRGDTADLLGKIGDPAAMPALIRVAEEDPDPDVREAARDALTNMEV